MVPLRETCVSNPQVGLDKQWVHQKTVFVFLESLFFSLAIRGAVAVVPVAFV